MKEKPIKVKFQPRVEVNSPHMKLQQKQGLVWLDVICLMKNADQKHLHPFHLLYVCVTKP